MLKRGPKTAGRQFHPHPGTVAPVPSPSPRYTANTYAASASVPLAVSSPDAPTSAVSFASATEPPNRSFLSPSAGTNSIDRRFTYYRPAEAVRAPNGNPWGHLAALRGDDGIAVLEAVASAIDRLAVHLEGAGRRFPARARTKNGPNSRRSPISTVTVRDGARAAPSDWPVMLTEHAPTLHGLCPDEVELDDDRSIRQ